MRKFSDPWNDINLSLTRIDDTDFALYSQSFVTVCSKKKSNVDERIKVKGRQKRRQNFSLCKRELNKEDGRGRKYAKDINQKLILMVF